MCRHPSATKMNVTGWGRSREQSMSRRSWFILVEMPEYPGMVRHTGSLILALSD